MIGILPRWSRSIGNRGSRKDGVKSEGLVPLYKVRLYTALAISIRGEESVYPLRVRFVHHFGREVFGPHALFYCLRLSTLYKGSPMYG